MLEMEPLLNRLPAELSGGQRQRVAIGRAIVKDPKVFMFDEPLSNLDAALRSRTRQEIANLHRRIKKTMVFVTHDQTEAMTLADRIVVMNQQRIEQVGTPSEIYSHPATLFVATFVGSPAMNILRRQLESPSEGATAAREIGRRHRSSKPPFRRQRCAPRVLCASACGRKSVQLCAAGAGTHATRKSNSSNSWATKPMCYLSLANDERLVAVDGAASFGARGRNHGDQVRPRAAHLFDAEGRNCRRPHSVTTRRAPATAWSAAATEARSGLLFVAPYLLVFTVLLIYPLFSGMWLSLHKADLFGGSQFIGFENYSRLFRDAVFLRSVRNTCYFVLLTVPALTLIGLGLALALNNQSRALGIIARPVFLLIGPVRHHRHVDMAHGADPGRRTDCQHSDDDRPAADRVSQRCSPGDARHRRRHHMVVHRSADDAVSGGAAAGAQGSVRSGGSRQCRPMAHSRCALPCLQFGAPPWSSS